MPEIPTAGQVREATAFDRLFIDYENCGRNFGVENRAEALVAGSAEEMTGGANPGNTAIWTPPH